MREDAIGQAGLVNASTQVRTFLIADIRGYTRFTIEHGDEAAAKLAMRFAELTKEVVGGREGEVAELRGDEAMAVFDSTRQALRAAIDLQERFIREASKSSLPFAVGIGIDAGEAIPVDGGFRGAALNLAARLCSLAGPGEVLASDTVANLARKIEGVEYRERGSVQLKGFVDEVRVVEVGSPIPLDGDPDIVASSDARAAPAARAEEERPLPIGGFLGALPGGIMVGRDEEMGRILDAVDAVIGGRGQLVFLAGEPGAGKTRLAQEATLAMRNRGFTIAAGSCFETRQTVPFYPFLDVLASLYGFASPDLRSEVSQRWPYLGRLLPEAGIPLPPQGSEAQDERERLFRAVTGFIQALARAVPVALMIDDLHWSDESSLELFQHIARHTRADRVLLLGAYRDVEVNRQHPLERTLRELQRADLTERIPIKRLTQDGTAAQMAATFGEEKVSREFLDVVYRHTEGNPFFTQEVLRNLVERGDVFQREGVWDRRDIAEIEVPDSVRSTIGERLSRLTEASQALLQEASVLGQRFGFDELQELANRDEEDVEKGIEEAVSAGLIREMGKDAYGFSHALVQQALYSELPPRRKRRMHLAAGEALEKLPAGEREARAAELAWHFLEADQPDRTMKYSLTAGRRAHEMYAHSEAERQFRTALEVSRELGDTASEARALVGLGIVLRWIGRHQEALEAHNRAVQLYQQNGDFEGEARMVAEMGFDTFLLGHPAEAIPRVEAMLRRLEQEETGDWKPRIEAHLYASLAHLFFTQGRHSEVLTASERARELSVSIGDERILAVAEWRRGTALFHLDREEEGRLVLEEGIPLAERANDTAALVSMLGNLASSYSGSGDLQRSRSLLVRGVRVFEESGSPWMAYQLVNLSDLDFALGNWELAEQHASRALEIVRAVGTSRLNAYPRLQLGMMASHRGEWERAVHLLEECCKLGKDYGDDQSTTLGQIALAELALLRDEPGEALSLLRPVLAEAEVFDRGASTSASTVAAAAHLLVGQEEAAEEFINRELSVKQNEKYRRPNILRVRGALRARQRRFQEAEADLGEAISLAQSMSMPYREATAKYEYGMMLAEQGEREDAEEVLREARGTFERLGAKPYLEKTEGAIEGLGPEF